MYKCLKTERKGREGEERKVTLMSWEKEGGAICRPVSELKWRETRNFERGNKGEVVLIEPKTYGSFFLLVERVKKKAPPPVGGGRKVRKRSPANRGGKILRSLKIHFKRGGKDGKRKKTSR